MSVSLQDIMAMLASRPPLAAKAPCAFDATLKTVSAQNDIPAEWVETLRRLAQIQQKAWPQFTHPRVALYASSYGNDNDAVHARLEKLGVQQDPLTRLCSMVNADLRVYELDLTAKIPANGLSEVEACHALSYGLMTVEEHVDCLVLETLSNGAEDVLHKWQDALAQNATENPLQLLRECGAGHDLFALMGAVLSARMAKIPVFGCGLFASLMPQVLARLLPDDAQFYITLPNVFAGDDTVQTIASLQTLMLVSALGPQVSTQRLVLPNAA